MFKRLQFYGMTMIQLPNQKDKVEVESLTKNKNIFVTKGQLPSDCLDDCINQSSIPVLLSPYYCSIVLKQCNFFLKY